MVRVSVALGNSSDVWEAGVEGVKFVTGGGELGSIPSLYLGKL
jgi:hypothetical protein